MDSINYVVRKSTASEYLYALTRDQAHIILADLVNGTFDSSFITSLFQSNNDYIIKLTYFPIKIEKFTTLGSEDNSFLIGNQTFTKYNKTILVPNAYHKLFDFSLSSYKLGNFLDYAPYTSISLHIPYFEPIILEPQIAYKMYNISVYLSMDLNSGKATLYVQGQETSDSTEYVLIATKTAQIGIEVAIGKSNKEEQTRNNALQTIGFIGSMVGLGVGAYSGNPLITAGSVGMLTKTVTTALANNVDRLQSYKGSSGDRSALSVDKRCYLMIEQPKNVTFPDASIKGRVCRQNLTLSTLRGTGYAEIGKIVFNPQDTVIYDNEKSEIVELLRTGVIL